MVRLEGSMGPVLVQDRFTVWGRGETAYFIAYEISEGGSYRYTIWLNSAGEVRGLPRGYARTREFVDGLNRRVMEGK